MENIIKLNIQRFAASLDIVVTETDINVTSNTSKVTLTITAKRTSGSTYWDASKTGTAIIDGVKYTFTLSLPSSKTSNSTTVTSNAIAHDSNGSKTISYSASLDTGTKAGTISDSGTKVLATIPRASTITSAANITLGGNCSVKWTPLSNTFQYRIKFAIGTDWSTTTGYIKPNTTSAYTYTGTTIPLSAANYIKNSATATMTVTLYSYNGDTLIGSTSSKNITVTVPNNADTKPTATISIAEANTAVKNTGWGVYVQNKSQLTVKVTGSAKYGATIKSYSTTVNGTTNTATSFTTGVLTGTGTGQVTVTDSRGYTGTASQSYTVVAYEKPKITDVSVARCTSNGTIDDQGTYLKYTFKASVSSVSNKNTATYKISYRESGTTTYTSVTISSSGYTLNKTNQILSNVTFNADKKYDIKFDVVDKLETTTITKTLETGFDLINFNSTGHAIAFGKVSDIDNSFQISDKLKFYIGATQFAFGSVDIDSYSFAANGYIRFKNGMQIAWQTKSSVTTSMTSWVTPIHYYDVTMGNWAKAFKTLYYASPSVGSTLYWATAGSYSASSAGTVRLFRPNASNTTVNVFMFGIGTWK